MSPWNNSHENEVDPEDWDGALYYSLDDAVCELCDSTTVTGIYDGTEEDPVLISDSTGYIVFHVNCQLMLRWTENGPEGATYMNVWASLSLYRWENNNWVGKCDDNFGIEFFGPDFKYDDFGLHVLEERDYQAYDQYWIHYQVNAVWWEGSTPHNLDESASEDIYFRII